MKIVPLVGLTALVMATAGFDAQAGGRGGIFIGAGIGCGPRYFPPPVFVASRVVYATPRVVYCPPAPLYCAPRPVVYTPGVRPVYRAPLVAPTVVVASPTFRWRR